MTARSHRRSSGQRRWHRLSAFYAYAYPAASGFRGASVRPDAACWHDGLSEFILPYEAVQSASDPDGALMAFLVSTYEAAADLGGWDRGLWSACRAAASGAPPDAELANKVPLSDRRKG